MTARSAAEPSLDGTRFPTPAYVYDLRQVRRSHRRLSSTLPHPSVLCYSLKANPHPILVAALAELGCWAEVSSIGEVVIAIAAGVPPNRILFTGPGKSTDDVTSAVRAGVRTFSVDSPTALAQVGRAVQGPDVDCLLRLNATQGLSGQGLAMAGETSQFGADAEWVIRRPERFRTGVTGLHLYLGSNLASEAALLAQFQLAIDTARAVSDVLGGPLRILNLGGGFGAPYARAGDCPAYPDLADHLASTLDQTFPGWRRGRPQVFFESGRHLVAAAGQLLTKVADVKYSSGRPVVVLESGINHLGGMSGLRRLPQLVPDLLADDRDGVLDDAMVTGPLCSPLDTWATHTRLPALRPGDTVRIPNVGAYGLSASLIAFLGHPAPYEVVVDGAELIDISRLVVERTVQQFPIADQEGQVT
ncbi:type III PLP-dependent enzyme [Kribbella albertanoniae]|uniref:Type III PLP-dependent enzyme n=2 Tax=Kribbella albertanoniae TaxID=1266829 RepID=A0A4R4QK12_9ACTN|nr:type III PLP-dependent enzyme [Kribbella albertanoniae]